MHSYWCILNWHAHLEENQKNDKTGKKIYIFKLIYIIVNISNSSN